MVAGATVALPTDDFRAADPFTVYAYVPIGVTAFNERLIAYPDAGWTYAQGGPHTFTWGLRAAAPGFQAGLQI